LTVCLTFQFAEVKTSCGVTIAPPWLSFEIENDALSGLPSARLRVMTRPTTTATSGFGTERAEVRCDRGEVVAPIDRVVGRGRTVDRERPRLADGRRATETDGDARRSDGGRRGAKGRNAERGG